MKLLAFSTMANLARDHVDREAGLFYAVYTRWTETLYDLVKNIFDIFFSCFWLQARARYSSQCKLVLFHHRHSIVKIYSGNSGRYCGDVERNCTGIKGRHDRQTFLVRVGSSFFQFYYIFLMEKLLKCGRRKLMDFVTEKCVSVLCIVIRVFLRSCIHHQISKNNQISISKKIVEVRRKFTSLRIRKTSLGIVS